MPTKLKKPVSRTTTGEFHGSGKGLRPINITLMPGDFIRMTWKGMRQPYDLPISVAMTKAQAAEAGGFETSPLKKRKL
jgi:hypothetical protein